MFVEENLYSVVVKSLPIVCVDLLITVRESNKFLLVNRAEEPMKGVLWPPGGRKHVGESFLEAAHRISEMELSASKKSIVFNENPLGIYHDLFNCSSFGNHQYETVSFLMEGMTSIANVAQLVTDGTISGLFEASELPVRMREKIIFDQKKVKVII